MVQRNSISLIHLTSKLRKYDSGMLTVGHDVSSLHLIPPGLDHFTTVAHCPDMCTQVSKINRECFTHVDLINKFPKTTIVFK